MAQVRSDGFQVPLQSIWIIYKEGKSYHRSYSFKLLNMIMNFTAGYHYNWVGGGGGARGIGSLLCRDSFPINLLPWLEEFL